MFYDVCWMTKILRLLSLGKTQDFNGFNFGVVEITIDWVRITLRLRQCCSQITESRLDVQFFFTFAIATVRSRVVSFVLSCEIACPSGMLSKLNHVFIDGVDAYNTHASSNSLRFDNATATKLIAQNVLTDNFLKKKKIFF